MQYGREISTVVPQPATLDYEADETLVVSDREQLRALSDELRARIVALLRERAWSTQELSRELDVPKGTVGHHLKVLERAGLIARDRSAQKRPSTLRAEPLEQATAWIETCRLTWNARMDRLDKHLEERMDL